MKRILKINSTRLKILMLSCACIIGLGLSETSAITVTSPRDGDCLVTAQAGDFISVQLMADVNPALWFDAGGVDLTTVFEPGFAWDQSGLIEGTLLGTVSGNIVFNVTVRNPNDATDQEVDVELTICIERDPIDIIFCLDKSGSMGLKADPDCVSNCDTRMDVLKNVITGVVSLWVSTNSVSLNNSDRIGIIYFDSDAAAPPANFSLASIGSQGQLAWEDVELQNPGGSTAMGAALQEAINQLPSAADVTKTIVLFSDGDQNVAPLVDEGTLQIGGGSIIGQGAAAHLKIYAIGVGSTAGATLLNSISNATAVDPGLISLNAFDEETIDAFISALLDAIRQGSPQIVTRKTGNLVNAQATVTMKVNKRVEKVMFMLNGRITDELSFQVFKDGVDVTRTRLTRLLGDNGITVYSIPTPSKDRAGNPIVSEGTWEMRIRGGNDPNAKYDAWGFVEEENIKYITSQGSGFNAVGNPLEIKTEVMYGGSPVTDANVTAIILKPGEDIGDLLATTQTDDGFKALEQGLSPAEEKFQQLSTDPTFAEQLGLRPTPEITLTNNGDGSYSANFNDTDLAGTYRAIFSIWVITSPYSHFPGTLGNNRISC
ncbi:MAG: vWA domain-containing protein, partial [Bacteroidota bacterium]